VTKHRLQFQEYSRSNTTRVAAVNLCHAKQTELRLLLLLIAEVSASNLDPETAV
jgi:hypothetical protein